MCTARPLVRFYCYVAIKVLLYLLHPPYFSRFFKVVKWIYIPQHLGLRVDLKSCNTQVIRMYVWKATKLDTEVVVGTYIRKTMNFTNYVVKNLYKELSCTNLGIFLLFFVVIYVRPTNSFLWIFHNIFTVSLILYLPQNCAFAWCHAIITLFGVPDNHYI
jgi:hypothetical protein